MRYFMLEGDWGGQMYATVPVRDGVDRSKLQEVLVKLDQIGWDCNEGAGTSLYEAEWEELGHYEAPMEGFDITGDIWIHPEFAGKIEDWAKATIRGENVPFPDDPSEWLAEADDNLRTLGRVPPRSLDGLSFEEALEAIAANEDAKGFRDPNDEPSPFELRFAQAFEQADFDMGRALEEEANQSF